MQSIYIENSRCNEFDYNILTNNSSRAIVCIPAIRNVDPIRLVPIDLQHTAKSESYVINIA